MRQFPHSLMRLFSDYTTATAGAVAVWAALSTPVIVGGAALSVDAARMYNVDSELQAAADAFARAGAAELDQRGDSLQRASRAVQQLLSHDEKFATGASTIEVDQIIYYKSLPGNDYDDIPTSARTNNPAEARYVEVKVKPKTVRTLFPPSMVRGLVDVTLEADSVAGMDQTVCGTAPVFICNPLEGQTETIYEAMETAEFRRTQVKFKTPNNVKDMYGRGNFGWLDPFGGNSGASVLRDAIAIDVPDNCYSQSQGVVMRTGNIASMSQGFNTRFDIYEGAFKRKASDPRYAPAANVVKGWANGGTGKGKGKKKTNNAGGCPSGEHTDALALPRDNCFANGTCDDERWGTGQWDFAEYMRVNHPGFSRITIEGVTYRINSGRGTFTPSAPPSRYAMYRWEIDNDCVPGAETYGNKALTPEEGLPQCHTSGASTTVADRRVITVAVLNCGAVQALQNSRVLGKKDPVPVETFVKVFLTEPMGKGQDNIIWGEIIGPLVPGVDSEANDQVAIAR